jgi:hypothetical protein
MQKLMLGKKKGGRGRGILGKSVVFSSISTQFSVFQGQIHPIFFLTSQELERILLQVQTLFNTWHPKRTPLLSQHCIEIGGHNPRLPTISL